MTRDEFLKYIDEKRGGLIKDTPNNLDDIYKMSFILFTMKLEDSMQNFNNMIGSMDMAKLRQMGAGI